MRLLTIHAAKGLEFKVVVVADAGRERAGAVGRRDPRLSDGRFGFKVADPVSSRRRVGASTTRRCARAREAEERAERLRLYYVAMTRAIDRLIVSGAVDLEQPRRRDADRLGARPPRRRARSSPGRARRRSSSSATTRGCCVRVDRYRPEPSRECSRAQASRSVDEDGQLVALRRALPESAGRGAAAAAAARP